MMRKIDWYIIKKYLGTFFFAISLIIIIVIIFDISEKIDDFIERDAPLEAIIFDYYLNFIPYFVNLFSPLFAFIAVIYFTSRMATRTEIVAILGSGVSFRRFMVPYVVAATALAVLSFMLSNFIIPPANKVRLAFEDIYIRGHGAVHTRNIHLQTEPGTFVYVETFNRNEMRGHRFSLEKVEKNGRNYKMDAEKIQYDTTNNTWRIINYVERFVDGKNETFRRGQTKDTVLDVVPTDFTDDIENMDVMNFFDIRDYIEKEKMKGTEKEKFYEVEKENRIANPFAMIILTIIGVSLSSRKLRGGLGLHLGLGIAIAFSYIMFMKVSTTFATMGSLSPVIAVWIPNIVFLLLGLYLYRRAPK